MRRYRRRRSRAPRPVTQSYKQIINKAPASVAAGTQSNVLMSQGLDDYAGPGASFALVPTGARIEKFDIQISMANLVTIASFVWITVQHLRSGQTAIDNQAVGGNPQRNQVHLQIQRSLGQFQNRDIVIPFRIPAKYQRVREGDEWRVSIKCDTIRTEAIQVIYKFLR